MLPRARAWAQEPESVRARSLVQVHAPRVLAPVQALQVWLLAQVHERARRQRVQQAPGLLGELLELRQARRGLWALAQ